MVLQLAPAAHLPESPVSDLTSCFTFKPVKLHDPGPMERQNAPSYLQDLGCRHQAYHNKNA